MKTLIEVRTIKHEDQRYPTWADWEVQEGMGVVIRVSDHSDKAKVVDGRYLYLAAIHELVEFLVCQEHGVTQDDVDKFDIDYENRRMRGEWDAACGCAITNDPGSDRHAPYKAAHHVAELIEYGLAKLLGVDPKKYDAAFVALDGGVAGNRK
jgi:hypothetical protein